MTRYFVGDSPVQVTVLVPDLGWDFALFQGADVRLIDPNGTAHAGLTATVIPISQTVRVTWPKDSLLDKPGLWQVLVVLTDPDGKKETFPPYYIPVEQEDGWHTLDSIRDTWRDAPMDDADLFVLLDAAKEMCIAKAPAVTGPIPLRYRLAQAMQARALWNTGHVSATDQFGNDNTAVYAYSMGYDIVKLLRPPRAIGGLF